MKRIGLLLVLAAVLGIGFSNLAQAADKAIVVKMAGTKPEGEPETLGMYKFAELLAQLSGGKYEVQVFPNNQLGKEDAFIAANRRGTIQMCAVGTQTSSLHPAMAMLETPMLFDSLDHARRAMEGTTFDLIHEGFPEKSGLRALNAYPLGFRHFYSKNALTEMKDLDGLRMRVPNIPLYINFAKECGISGQPMPFAEVPSALDQGVIDGGDSPIVDIASLKMYEITPNITLSGHILVVHGLFINEKFYQKLPEQDKAWFDQAAKESADYVWDLMAHLEDEAIAEIKAEGGLINTPSAEFHQAMVEAGQRSWKLFYDTVPNAQAIFDSAATYK